MYKEIAIDPACMAEFEYYGLLKLETGYEKGRYLVADVRSWASEAHEIVKKTEMSWAKKKAVNNFLNSLKKGAAKYKKAYFVSPKDRGEISADYWERWWSKQQDFRQFSVTLSERQLEGSHSYTDLIEKPEIWRIGPTELLKRNFDDIVDVVEPLLLMSNELLIVDSYFKFAGNKTLKEIFKRLRKYKSLADIHLVTCIDTKFLDNVFRKEYAKYIPQGVNFTHTVMPDSFIHDRFFITDVGAIKAGHGFEEDTKKGVPADYLSVNLASLDEVLLIKNGLAEALQSEKAKETFSTKNATGD